MDHLISRAYDWTAQKYRIALDFLRPGPEDRARWHARLERLFPWVVVFSIVMMVFVRWVSQVPFSIPEQHTSPLSWTLDPTSPYHVVASLPGESFTHAQVTKLDIGWEAAPFPAEFDKGGWRGRTIDPVNFAPFQDKLDPHYPDLVAKSWPDNKGVGVALGHHAGIVEFVAAITIYNPEDGRRMHVAGAVIEHVAIVPGAQGGDRLSLPRLLKEGWVMIGKEEEEESKDAAKQRRREDPQGRLSSGGYAWDGSREFEGHKEGGWKDWGAKYPYNPQRSHGRGKVPVLTLRHRSTGMMLKANQKGDGWVVNTLVEDNRPRPQAWERVWTVIYYPFHVCLAVIGYIFI